MLQSFIDLDRHIVTQRGTARLSKYVKPSDSQEPAAVAHNRAKIAFERLLKADVDDGLL
jgi:hypothetical protein